MNKQSIARDINKIEEILEELSYDKQPMRDECWKWLRNIRDDINSFLKEFDFED